MKISENHNTCIGKYGWNLTNEIEKSGIPSMYLLSACRFHTECDVPIQTLYFLFKQWDNYVMKNDKIDVNTKSFEEFMDILSKYKRMYGIPNKIYDDGQVSIGRINSHKDMLRFPVKNEWCISKPRQFKKYTDEGYHFYLIDNGDESDYVRYVVLMVGDNGKKYYYDMDNSEMTDRSISEFQMHLTKNSIEFINNLNECTIYKKNNNNSNNNNTQMKQKLTEAQLNRIIKESVKKILKESSNEEQNYQVNIFDSVDGDVMAYVTRYSSDGYRGTTIGTRYSNGYDSTEWCVFVGTEEECKKWAEQYNEKHS